MSHGISKKPAITRPFDTVPGRTAREWFDHLRPRLLASRPIIGHTENGGNVYGKPTFRNVVVTNDVGRLEHI